MLIKTSDPKTIIPYLKKLKLPASDSHKGQNGRLLIIGGSRLFHSASLWSAEVASHFVDLVHYSSTEENNKIFINLKSKFTNGIVIEKKDLLSYIEEDDCILIGPGMLRGEKPVSKDLKFADLLKITDEAHYAHFITKFLLKNYPEKKFVIDGGALQMMENNWLKKMMEKSIVTPHGGEFEKLTGLNLRNENKKNIQILIKKKAQEFRCIILLKMVDIFISDGTDVFIIEGGNQGLTKGGTGDVLAGLTASLNTKNDQILSCILSSYIVKKSADMLGKSRGFFFNTGDLINQIPKTLKSLLDLK